MSLWHPLFLFLYEAFIILKIASLLIGKIGENKLLGGIAQSRHALFLAGRWKD